MTTRTSWDPILDTGDPPLAVFKPADVISGERYWRLHTARWLGVSERQPAIYVDVWDETGNRLVDAPVRFWRIHGVHLKKTEAKPGDNWAVDMPLHNAGAVWSVEVADGLPSDRVEGMGMGTPQERHQGLHTGYLLIFQRTVARDGDGPVEPPDGTEEWETIVGEVADELNRSARHLQGLADVLRGLDEIAEGLRGLVE